MIHSEIPMYAIDMINKLREAVVVAEKQFSFYEREHLKKGTDDGDKKANTNRKLAKQMRDALEGTDV